MMKCEFVEFCDLSDPAVRARFLSAGFSKALDETSHKGLEDVPLNKGAGGYLRNGGPLSRNPIEHFIKLMQRIDRDGQ